MADQMTKRFDEGLSVRRQVLGASYVDNAFSEAEGDPMSEELQKMVTEFGWGVTWTRPGLSLKTRSMLNLSILTALNRPHEFKTQVPSTTVYPVMKSRKSCFTRQCTVVGLRQSIAFVLPKGFSLKSMPHHHRQNREIARWKCLLI